MSLYEKELINQVSRLEREKAELTAMIKRLIAVHQNSYPPATRAACWAEAKALLLNHEAK